MDCYGRHPDGGVHCSICKVIMSCRRTTRERLLSERRTDVLSRRRVRNDDRRFFNVVMSRILLEMTLSNPRNTSQIVDDVSHWKRISAGRDLVVKALRQLRRDGKVIMVKKGIANYWVVK